MQTISAEKRKYPRHSTSETLCAVFETGTFGQVMDISKNGISVLVLGCVRNKEEKTVGLFQLSGTNIINNIHCSHVRQEKTNSTPTKNKKENLFEIYCLKFTNIPPSLSEQFNFLINNYCTPQKIAFP